MPYDKSMLATQRSHMSPCTPRMKCVAAWSRDGERCLEDLLPVVYTHSNTRRCASDLIKRKIFFLTSLIQLG